MFQKGKAEWLPSSLSEYGFKETRIQYHQDIL